VGRPWGGRWLGLDHLLAKCALAHLAAQSHHPHVCRAMARISPCSWLRVKQFDFQSSLCFYTPALTTESCGSAKVCSLFLIELPFLSTRSVLMYERKVDRAYVLGSAEIRGLAYAPYRNNVTHPLPSWATSLSYINRQSSSW
jgi:hypothetical protein